LKRISKKYNLLYKTINLINGNSYIGQHSTDDIEDGYLGSGNDIKEDIGKYGKENFKREILFYCKTKEDLNILEREFVDEEFVSRLDTYNINIGGFGNWYYVNKNKLNTKNTFDKWDEDYLKKIQKKCLDKVKYLRENDEDWVKEYSKKVSKGLKKYFENGGTPFFTGKKHSDETKRKIGDTNALKLLGENNGSYGTCWIYSLDLKENKKINKMHLDSYIKNGWLKGRKFDF